MKENSDKKLVALIQQGKTEYYTELVERYKVNAKYLAREIYSINKNCGVSEDEMFSAAFVSIEVAVSKFNTSRNNSFRVYWTEVARNAITDLLKRQSYFGGGRAFGGISLDGYYGEDETLINADKIGVEDNYQSVGDLSEELVKEVKDPANKFTNRERQIIYLLLSGYDRDEIPPILHISSSTFRVHLKSAKAKVRKILEKNN